MTRRAGRWARSATRRDRLVFIRQNAVRFLAASLAYVALGVAVCLLLVVVGDGLLVPYAIGGLAVGYFWFFSALLDAMDGTFLRRQGASAEELTSAGLRRLRRAGWSHVDAVEFAGSDVDHVLVGPGGIWAIETKTSMVPMTIVGDRLMTYGGDACVQSRDGAKKIGLLLASEGIELPVRAAIAAWGPGAPALAGGAIELPSPRAPVLVVQGRDLRSVFGTVDRGELDAAQIDQVRTVLARFIEKRDKAQAGAGRARREANRPAVAAGH